MGLHQTKNCCTANATIHITKREPSVWENVIASDTSGKRLISKYIKNSHNPTPGRSTVQFKNGQRVLAGVAQLAGTLSRNQTVVGLISGQSTRLGCRFNPRSGCIRRQTISISLSHQCASLSLSLSLALSLRAMKNFPR